MLQLYGPSNAVSPRNSWAALLLEINRVRTALASILGATFGTRDYQQGSLKNAEAEKAAFLKDGRGWARLKHHDHPCDTAEQQASFT